MEAGALALLRAELASEEVAVRVNAVRRLPLVARALGDSPHAREVLLMLADRLTRECEEDELLLGLAEALLALAPHFRVAAAPVLERLLLVEESVVREKAREAFAALVRQADRAELSALAPALLRLAQSEAPLARAGALHLLAEVGGALPELERRQCLERLYALATDESLPLRRALASRLGALARQLGRAALLAEVLPRAKALAADESDQVKGLVAAALPELAVLLAPDENRAHLVPLVIQLTSDKSWRVKLQLAKHFGALARAMGAELADGALASVFSALLRDPENEVRVAAARALAPFARLVSTDKLAAVLAHVAVLARDAVALVRVGAAEVLAAVLEAHGAVPAGRELARARLLPLAQELLADRELEVKLEALALLRPLARALGPAALELLVAAPLLDLEASQWRARLASLEALLGLCEELRAPRLFERHFRRPLLLALRDRAFRVRQAAVRALPRLALHLEPPQLAGLLRETARAALAPEAAALRISALYALTALAPLCEERAVVREAVQRCLCPLSEEPLALVRQAALRALLVLCPAAGEALPDAEAALGRAAQRETDAEVARILAKA